MNRLVLVLAVICALPVYGQNRRVTMIFTPQDATFTMAAEEYRRLWDEEGPTIIAAMEQGSGLAFLEKEVKAVIFEGPSSSGFGDRPMMLRASYPPEVKKATLVHELGHRMNGQLRRRPPDIDEHRILFLYLYDVWESLYGKTFADQQVVIESGRTGLYDYDTAWKWAMAMTKAERASRFAAIVKDNRR
jgi:hypothetical protein